MSVISRLFLPGGLKAALNRLSVSKTMLAGGACAAALLTAPVAHSAVLFLQVWDNGALIGSAGPSTFGIIHFTDTGDPAFASISVDANGPSVLPFADLSSTTLDISSGSISTPHVLTVDVFQIGVSAAAGTNTMSTFTVNNLIGHPGPTTESTFFDGTDSTLGTLLHTATFPAGTTTATFGPVNTVLTSALTADAEQYTITFTRPRQSANDTIELTTGIPETSTWAMMLLGFASLAYAAHRRVKAPATLFG